MAFSCSRAQGIASGIIDINNMEAAVYSDGGLFLDPEALIGHFYVPKPDGGTPLSTIFGAGIWIAASDSAGGEYTAVHLYGQGGHDFWAGPVANDYTTDAYLDRYNQVWVCDKPTIEAHKINFETDGYIVPDAIANWPGNGNVANGESNLLAPFFDYNNNLIYDPVNGDYPLIRGDEAAFFIFNDDAKPHTQSFGEKLKVEIHAMAYAFDAPEDSALNNTLFLNYEIINRSNTNYSDLYMGVFSDFDIGSYDDDYVGCDVDLNMFYGYNGDGTDGPGMPNYGAAVPAQGIVFLNHHMNMFKYYVNDFSVIGNPENADDYNNYLKGNWKDETGQTFGGNGYGGVTPYNYMFPGEIYDPLEWSEVSAENVAADKRGLASVDPKMLQVNDTLCFDLAFPYAIAYDTTGLVSQGLGNLSWLAVAKLKERAAAVIDFYLNTVDECSLGYTANPDFVGAVNEESNNMFEIFPNPATEIVYIRTNMPLTESTTVEVFNAGGVKVGGHQLVNENTAFDMSEFSAGLYLFYISNEKNITETLVVCKQ